MESIDTNQVIAHDTSSKQTMVLGAVKCDRSISLSPFVLYTTELPYLILIILFHCALRYAVGDISLEKVVIFAGAATGAAIMTLTLAWVIASSLQFLFNKLLIRIKL